MSIDQQTCESQSRHQDKDLRHAFRKGAYAAIDLIAEGLAPAALTIATSLHEMAGSDVDPWSDFRRRRAIGNAMRQLDAARDALADFLTKFNVTVIEADITPKGIRP